MVRFPAYEPNTHSSLSFHFFVDLGKTQQENLPDCTLTMSLCGGRRGQAFSKLSIPYLWLSLQ